MRYGWGDLTPLDTVISQTRQRAKHRNNWDVDKISELGIEYQEQHPQLPSGGFVATRMKDSKGRPLALAPSAVSTACKLLGVRQNFFNGFEDNDAFPKMLRNKLDNPNRKGRDPGFRIRTGLADNGREELQAILPGSYEIRDAHTQLADFAQMVQENLGPIKGVDVMEQGFGKAASYRFIVGENIMPGTSDETGQFMMFCLRMSELGLFDDETSLGLFRLICTNGAIGWDTAQIAKWSHKTPLADYLTRTGDTVHKSTHFQQIWSRLFTDMTSAKLDNPAADYVHDMKSRNLITEAHFDATDLHVKSGQEPDKTQYDLYNLLTRGAQDLPDIRARQSAERKTLKIFTEGGGVVAQLDKARIRHENKGNLDVHGRVMPHARLQTEVNQLMNQN